GCKRRKHKRSIRPTTGTILVLNFAEVIQLTAEFYAPDSLGSFNLQLQVTVENNQNYDWAGNEYELVIMVMNSGVFVNERGTSSTFIGLLTKQDVLDALQQQPYSNNEVRRIVGGGFLDNIRSGLGWITSKLPMVRGVLVRYVLQHASDHWQLARDPAQPRADVVQAAAANHSADLVGVVRLLLPSVQYVLLSEEAEEVDEVPRSFTKTPEFI
ncbi:MAG: major capsid protein V20 domain-containing protein, partial [Candidatus Fonsibacter sp.]